MFNFKNSSGNGLKSQPLPFILLLAFIFILPLFFLPLGISTLIASKLFLVHVFTLVTLFVWVLFRLKDKTVSIPFNLFSLAIALIPTIYVLAGIFSKNVYTSFFARDFALDSVVTVLVLFFLLILSATIINNKLKIFYVYIALFTSFIVVGLVQLINVLIPAFPSFGILNNSVSTTLGKWNDLAIFSALVASLSITTLYLTKLVKNYRMILNGVLALALVLLVIVNFKLAWYVLGVFSLLFLIYTVVFGKNVSENKSLPVSAIATLVISLLFIVAGQGIGGSISEVLNINHFEVRPSWGSTMSVISDTLSQRPILGSGPALFEIEWMQHKPQNILLTDFWNLDFRYGVGLIPSMFATTGILGGLTWVFFFVVLLLNGFKAIFKKNEDSISDYLLVSSFVASALLWLSMIFYLPSATMVVLAFVFTGIHISVLFQEKIFKVKTLNINIEPKFNFLYITVLVIILIIIGTTGYHSVSRFVAHINFKNAAYELNNQGNINKAEAGLQNALRLEKSDVYFRSLGELETIRMISSLNDPSLSQEEAVEQFRDHLAKTIDSYQLATERNPLNYNNYLGLANLYNDLVTLNIQGSYEQALALYNKVLEIKPNSPDLYLRLARLEINRGNTEQAREYIRQSINIKPNYIDAVFLFSQIEVAEGRIEEAIVAVESASVIRPNDSTIFFQLGLLKYNNGDFLGASTAFERAILINPEFQNAKYFLGLSYYEIDNIASSMRQFEDLRILNPDNQEILFILENLNSGRAPFTDAQPPLDEEPEDREELPLDDGELSKSEGQTSDLPSEEVEEPTEE